MESSLRGWTTLTTDATVIYLARRVNDPESSMVVVHVCNRWMKFKEKGQYQLTFLLIGSSSFSNLFDLVSGLHEIFLWINRSEQYNIANPTVT